MTMHITRVGVHARNAVHFAEADYALVREARIETLKTMTLTGPGVYERLRRENPDLEFIVRLFDDRVRSRSRPRPGEFVQRMAPIIQSLRPYALKFEIHNEPNHSDGLEGWGASDADARSFLSWYMHVLVELRKACPWARFGFPGLALNHPHRDLEWLAICREAVEASDWLGCHCYWQNDNMLSDNWGLRFKLYHSRFPNKRIEITEFGDSTPDLSPDERANRYVRYYTELHKYFYLGSASAFIASSPDPAWAPFAWLREGGHLQPTVRAVGTMERKPVEVVVKRYFKKTGKTVRGAFLDFYDKYGLGICGFPITELIEEDGVPTQYFQHLALQEATKGKVSLKPVGAEAWGSRPKIAQLSSLVDQLSAQPLPTAEGIIDKLAELTGSLAAQIQALQQELTRAGPPGKPGEGGQPDLAAMLAELIKALQTLSDRLHAELATALKAMSEEQTALVEHLRAQVQELEAQLAARPPLVPRAPKPVINDIVYNLTVHATERYPLRPRTDIQTLVIHHSATGANVEPDALARYHVNQWHWPGIGYHFLVASDGTLYQTNEMETQSNHASGCNHAGVGICFLGNFMQQPPPPAQLRSGAQLIAWLLQELHLDLDDVKGHRELMATACPGDQWLSGASWRVSLMDQVAVLKG